MTQPRPIARSPWTVGVADFSARHRWPVFGLWFVFTLGIFAASLGLGGTDTAEAVSNDQRARFESSEAYLVYSPPGTTPLPSAGACTSRASAGWRIPSSATSSRKPSVSAVIAVCARRSAACATT